MGLPGLVAVAVLTKQNGKRLQRSQDAAFFFQKVKNKRRSLWRDLCPSVPFPGSELEEATSTSPRRLAHLPLAASSHFCTERKRISCDAPTGDA